MEYYGTPSKSTRFKWRLRPPPPPMSCMCLKGLVLAVDFEVGVFSICLVVLLLLLVRDVLFWFVAFWNFLNN